MHFVLPAHRSDDTEGMKKLLFVIAFALSIMSTVSVHADPPVPVCPPYCNGHMGGGTGN